MGHQAANYSILRRAQMPFFPKNLSNLAHIYYPEGIL